ncbi:MAG: DUF2470 domain-containing protein [Nocardiaceae bacterium]|nr:DUF2470 domain-containing protein [Nocardiaceae bacterium]
MVTTPTIPTAAERIRTIAMQAPTGVLAADKLEPAQTSWHYLCTTGDMLIAVRNDSPPLKRIGESGLPAVLELTDSAPLPFREPVRGLVWLRGTLHRIDADRARQLVTQAAEYDPAPALLDIGHTTTLIQMNVESGVAADTTGAEPATRDALQGSMPDPFWNFESDWLQHLDADHPDLLAMLARRLPPSLRQGRIRPLALDRYGITLRVESGPVDDRDVRLSFAQPVSSPEALSRAIRVLIGCPFLNGLRQRTV